LEERQLANGQPEPEFTAEDAAQIHAALDRLPAHQREVLVLRFLEDMSYEDIARVIGCPLGTLRSRLHHAKRALRDALNTQPRSPNPEPRAPLLP
jgi:RNA polymerase sigma-70 factor (ECF subfamily)